MVGGLEVRMKLPTYIREAREREGLTQAQAGERMGWSQKTWSRVETGERVLSRDELKRACSVLPGLTLESAVMLHAVDLLSEEAA